MLKSKIYKVITLLSVGILACEEPKSIETIDLSELTISAIHKAYQEGTYNSNQLVQTYLERIERANRK